MDILEIEQLEYYKKQGYNEEQYLLNAAMNRIKKSANNLSSGIFL